MAFNKLNIFKVCNMINFHNPVTVCAPVTVCNFMRMLTEPSLFPSCGMWNLPGPGIEPGFPALAGGFLTTGPPRKSSIAFVREEDVNNQTEEK